MVVDDDSEVREVTATRLGEAGYEVCEAGSGLQALAALEADPCIDLVVIDFLMPGMNGTETATEVRKRRLKIPVLFVADFADTAALKKAGAAGPERIVQKPFRDGDLERKVAGTLAAAQTSHLKLVSDRD